MEDIRKNLETVRAQISEAAEIAGRKSEDVILVAVSKTRTPEEVNTAIDAGVTDIGENKVQVKLAKEIDKRAKAAGKTMDILVQINPAEEESKFGVTIDGAGDLVREILANFENIRIKGLMSVAPIVDDPRDVKPFFDAVKAKYDELAQIDDPKLDFEYLSMGMSHDFAVAIEAGSNLVRVGSAIFGERDYVQYRKDQEAKKNGNV